jgi:hypothetical protein
MAPKGKTKSRNRPAEMEKEWVKIFEYNDEIKGEMARQILADENIESVLMNKRDRSYGFGVVELYVQRDMVILAKRLLKELEP